MLVMSANKIVTLKIPPLTKFSVCSVNFHVWLPPPCSDVVLDHKVGRVKVLDDKVPPLVPPDEFAASRLADHFRQLPVVMIFFYRATHHHQVSDYILLTVV